MACRRLWSCLVGGALGVRPCLDGGLDAEDSLAGSGVCNEPHGVVDGLVLAAHLHGDGAGSSNLGVPGILEKVLEPTT